jgi:hypothetical protein
MGMDVILFIDEECPPCLDAQEAMIQYIEAEEVKVMPIQEGLKQFDLGQPEGVPFLAVISPSTKKAINKIYFQGTPTQEIKAESLSPTESGS